jgi:ankyrin repeat protein
MDTEMLQMLLQAGAPANQTDAAGNTPLHLAVQWGATDCPRLLLQAHAPLDVTNEAGETPLRVAVKCGAVGNVELLLAAGARTDLGLGSNTLLHVAVAPSEPPPFMPGFGLRSGAGAIALLLKHGLGVDSRDGQGRTPFLCAVEAMDLEAMDLLLANGANINAADARGNTALHQHASSYWDTIHRRVPRPGPVVPPPPAAGQMILPMSDKRISITAWLLEHGADPNLTNHEGRTPLELLCDYPWGARFDDSDVLDRMVCLIKAGAKASNLTEKGRDLLRQAEATARGVPAHAPAF